MDTLKLKGHQLKVYKALSMAPNMEVLRLTTGLKRRQIEDAMKGLRDKGINIISGCFKIRITKKRDTDEECEICKAYDCVGGFK